MARRSKYIFVNDSARHSGSHFFRGLLFTLVIIVLIIGLLNFIMSREVRYNTQTITIQNLPADLQNFTILHISDLRGMEFGEDQRGIVDKINLRAYSCVVFTGDMLGDDGDVQPFLKLIRSLPQDVTKFFVPGDNDPPVVDTQDHGNLNVYAQWVQQVQEAGAILLDEPVSMTRGKSQIWFVPAELYGLDLDSMETAYQRRLTYLDGMTGTLTPQEKAERRICVYQLDRIDRIRQFVRGVNTSTIQIAVTHTPLAESYVSEMIQTVKKEQPFSLRYVSLFLAGHYCGGGWRIPGAGALYVDGLGQFPKDELIQGVNYLNSIPQHISGGLAGPSDSRLPGRLFNVPSITMLTLTNSLR